VIWVHGQQPLFEYDYGGEKVRSFADNIYDQHPIQHGDGAPEWMEFGIPCHQKNRGPDPEKVCFRLTYAKIDQIIENTEEISTRQQAVWSYNSKRKGGGNYASKRHPYGPTTQSPCTVTPDRGLGQPPNKGQGLGLSLITIDQRKVPA